MGKTGPCDEALIEAGVSRVVYATEDPFEKNDKNMPDKLNDAGISVSVGLLRDEAKQLNRGFFSRVIKKTICNPQAWRQYRWCYRNGEW